MSSLLEGWSVLDRSAFSPFDKWTHEYPYFFFSYFPHTLFSTKHIYTKRIDGKLYCCRVSSMYGRNFFVLRLPGDIQETEKFIQAGFTVQNTEYGNIEGFTLNKEACEYIYDVEEVFEAKGSSYARLRTAVRNFEREGFTITEGWSFDVADFVARYNKEVGKKYITPARFASLDWNSLILLVVRDRTGMIYGVTVIDLCSSSEGLHGLFGVCIERMHLRSSKVDMDLVLHYETCWSLHYLGIKYYNFGCCSGVNDIYKKRLHPCKVLQVYRKVGSMLREDQERFFGSLV
jgi:hypothetical protein